MKRLSSYVLFAVILALMLGGCVHQVKQENKIMNMEMQSYDAHFPDMDTNGDEMVSWEEFNNQFANADKNHYEMIDLNKDGGIDHEEWHDFKAGSGLEIREVE